jgi:SH3-like domain-containing protein
MKPFAVMIMILLLVFSSGAWAERWAVAVSVGNVRSGPGEHTDILWEVEKYYPLDIFKTSGQWYQFRDFEGDEGWIHKSLVSKIPTIITKNEKCNIRSGPGTGFSIVFTVEKGVPFKIIKREGSWINIEHADGDKGWIFNSLVW